MSALRQSVDRERSATTRYEPVRASARPEDSTLSLWRRYRRQGDPAARAELLERHLPLVRLLARKLASRIGGMVEVDDLVSAGTLGLVQALESYDLSRANSFATYASRRIHGSMLDELRRRDWVPRSVRSKARRLQQASGRIESVLGRAPAPDEMAAVLEIDVPTYWSWRQTVDSAMQVSLEDGPSGGQDESTPISALISAPDVEDSLDGLTRQESVAALSGALSRLSERERTVLVLYFYEELNLREIAQVLHLTESRISQIRSGALIRLRGMLMAEVA